jgi:hypothetical protein
VRTERIVLHLAGDGSKEELGEDAGQAKGRARLAKPAIEDVKNERRFDIDKRKDRRLWGFIDHRLAYRWHRTVVPIYNALHVLLEPKAVLVIAQ